MNIDITSFNKFSREMGIFTVFKTQQCLSGFPSVSFFPDRLTSPGPAPRRVSLPRSGCAQCQAWLPPSGGGLLAHFPGFPVVGFPTREVPASLFVYHLDSVFWSSVREFPCFLLIKSFKSIPVVIQPVSEISLLFISSASGAGGNPFPFSGERPPFSVSLTL